MSHHRFQIQNNNKTLKSLSKRPTSTDVHSACVSLPFLKKYYVLCTCAWYLYFAHNHPVYFDTSRRSSCFFLLFPCAVEVFRPTIFSQLSVWIFTASEKIFPPACSSNPFNTWKSLVLLWGCEAGGWKRLNETRSTRLHVARAVRGHTRFDSISRRLFFTALRSFLRLSRYLVALVVLAKARRTETQFLSQKTVVVIVWTEFWIFRLNWEWRNCVDWRLHLPRHYGVEKNLEKFSRGPDSVDFVFFGERLRCRYLAHNMRCRSFTISRTTSFGTQLVRVVINGVQRFAPAHR